MQVKDDCMNSDFKCKMGLCDSSCFCWKQLQVTLGVFKVVDLRSVQSRLIYCCSTCYQIYYPI